MFIERLGESSSCGSRVRTREEIDENERKLIERERAKELMREQDNCNTDIIQRRKQMRTYYITLNTNKKKYR